MSGPDRRRLLVRLAGAAAVALAIAACGDKAPESASQQEPPEGLTKVPVERGNPASKNCRNMGGTTMIAKRPDGGEYGVCVFVNGGQCEEWAMLLGFCPQGGVDVSVYPDAAARYCVMRGGKYLAGESQGDAQCLLMGGETCGVEAYYSGDCGVPK